MRKLLPLLFAFAALPAVGLVARQQPESLTMTSVNEAEWQDEAERSPALLVKLQVLLDRAHASPGVIDGTPGENTRKAIAAFAEMKDREPTEQVNEQLWRAVVETGSKPALTTYKITEKDVRGPFSKKIPEDFRKRAAMDRRNFLRALGAGEVMMGSGCLGERHPPSAPRRDRTRSATPSDS